METNGTTLPKIDRSDWDHDPMAVDVFASDLIAGDLVPGLGILDAILEDDRNYLRLCSGAASLRIYRMAVLVGVCGAICPDCDMHPDDCATHGCGRCAAAVA